MIRFPIAALLIAVSCAAHAAEQHVIICGSGGEEVYRLRFQDWGERLRDVLTGACGIPQENVTLFTETGEDGAAVSTIENINAAFEALAQAGDADMRLTVYLIGHGSYRRNVSKLMIPGPDLDAEALAAHLDAIAPAECNVLVTSSSNAGFVNVLSAPGRVLVSATKSVDQRNATEFTEYLLQALEKGGADKDRDDRISFLEACTHAAELTQAAYVADHLVATETTILDDDGDGLGTRLPLADDAADGRLAAARYLKEYDYPDDTPQEEIDAYRVALAAVEDYTQQKDEVGESTYYAELEKLLVQAARANQSIRAGAEEAPATGAVPQADDAEAEQVDAVEAPTEKVPVPDAPDTEAAPFTP